MIPFTTTMKMKEAALPIKKEIQDFIIATENLYRLLRSSGCTLTCHEVEILNCCLEEISAMDRPPGTGRRIKRS